MAARARTPAQCVSGTTFKPGPNEKHSSSTDRIGPFYRCGGFGHLASSRHCPARNKTCNFCRIKGPLAAVCRKNKQGESPGQNVTPVQAQMAQTASVLTVDTSLPSRGDLRVPVVVGHDVHMQLLVDTAGSCRATKDEGGLQEIHRPEVSTRENFGSA